MNDLSQRLKERKKQMTNKRITKLDMIHYLQEYHGVAQNPVASRIWYNSTYPKVKKVYTCLKKYRDDKQRNS